MKNKLLVSLLLALMLALTFTTALTEGVAVVPPTEEELISRAANTELQQKVQQLKTQCLAECSTNYDKAVWMHDWLTNNATYDYTYTEHRPEGVLLYGTGVCQSYAEAYKLLMDSVGISCEVLYAAEEMDHAWNLVELNGVWCHVDVTWDDPGEGGYENHFYFGMNDTLMGRDHQWNRSAYRKCTSLANYYLKVFGDSYCVESEQEMKDYLSAQAANEAPKIEIAYIGADSAFDIVKVFSKWLSANINMYGITQYTYSYSDYQITLELTYGGTTGEAGEEAEDVPYGVLDNPVPAPDFKINSPRGAYKLSDYLGKNGVVLIFGRPTCGNTRSLLARMQSSVKGLNSRGVDVIVSLDDTSTPDDLDKMTDEFPDYHYGYWDWVWSDYHDAITSYESSYTFPFVYIINSNGQIVYWSEGYVYDVDTLISAAASTGTGKKLPEHSMDLDPANTPANANVNNISSGAVKTALQNACAKYKHVYFLTDYMMYEEDMRLLKEFEENYSLYKQLGYQVVTCFVNSEDMTNYPHVIDVPCENMNFFWDMLRQAVGTDVSHVDYYQTCYAIESNGHITSYVNGSVLNMKGALLHELDTMKYGYTVPQDLTKIEAEAFARNSAATVDLSTAKVTSIGSKAFANCQKLILVKIPATVTTIAADAFTGCSSNLIIVCPYQSAAYYYAKEHGITCITR